MLPSSSSCFSKTVADAVVIQLPLAVEEDPRSYQSFASIEPPKGGEGVHRRSGELSLDLVLTSHLFELDQR